MSRSFGLVLDENTERDLKARLEELGHDAERVVEIDTLGPGATDREVVDYCQRTDRMLVTFDDDFLSEHEAIHRIGILFEATDRRPPVELASRIDRVSRFYAQGDITRARRAIYLNSDEWGESGSDGEES